MTPRARPNPTQKTDQQTNFRCFSHQSSFESLSMWNPAKKPVRAPKIWLTMLTPMSSRLYLRTAAEPKLTQAKTTRAVNFRILSIFPAKANGAFFGWIFTRTALSSFQLRMMEEREAATREKTPPLHPTKVPQSKTKKNIELVTTCEFR